MIARKGILLIKSSLCILALSSCSSLKKSTGSKNPVSSQDSQQVQFLDGIAVSRSSRSMQRFEGRNVGAASEMGMSSSSLENAAMWQFKYAQLLDVPVEQVLNGRLYGFIDEWYGTPYRLGGKTRDGIDCSNFVSTLLSTVFQLNLIGNSWQLYEQVKRLSARQLQEGDLVFFKIGHGHVSHVGVYLDNDHFVHASTSAGVIISDLNEPYWKKYFVGGGRVE